MYMRAVNSDDLLRIAVPENRTSCHSRQSLRRFHNLTTCYSSGCDVYICIYIDMHVFHIST